MKELLIRNINNFVETYTTNKIFNERYEVIPVNVWSNKSYRYNPSVKDLNIFNPKNESNLLISVDGYKSLELDTNLLNIQDIIYKDVLENNH